MSDRALWAAFQKVRTEVEGALEETRKKEAQRIEAEEKRRREEKAKKRAPQPAASAAPSARLVRGEAPKVPSAGKPREAQGPSAPAPRTGRPNAAPSRGAAPVAQGGNDAFRRALASVRKDTGPDEKTVRTRAARTNVDAESPPKTDGTARKTSKGRERPLRRKRPR